MSCYWALCVSYAGQCATCKDVTHTQYASAQGHLASIVPRLLSGLLLHTILAVCDKKLGLGTRLLGHSCSGCRPYNIILLYTELQLKVCMNILTWPLNVSSQSELHTVNTVHKHDKTISLTIP